MERFKRLLTLVLSFIIIVSMSGISALEGFAMGAEVEIPVEEQEAEYLTDNSEELLLDEEGIITPEEAAEVQEFPVDDETAIPEDIQFEIKSDSEDKISFDESLYRTLKSRSVIAKKWNINMRSALGEPHSGYGVAQGAATDGTYAYFMMVSSSTQKGRILKTNLSGGVIKKGPIIKVHHANGMTYDSKRNVLVAVGAGSYRQQLSFIDPETLTLIKQENVKYDYNDMIEGVSSKAKNNGIAAIAYVEKYDVYLARSRGNSVSNADTGINNDIIVFDAKTLQKIGHIYTKVSAKYPATYQAMDADEKYVYYLLSPGSKQKKNIILCLDWNSEKLLPVVNAETKINADGSEEIIKYVDKKWKCNNNNSGEPDAVIKIPISHESEGIFHTTDENGLNHFYVSEYHGKDVYKTVTKKKAYKVKWKKVTKKVKWKKVNGKWKYKKKKVWKYKTKYKKVKVKVKDYRARNDYVYDLGSF